ncbi:NucT-like nuclease [Arthrobacter phage Amelia]|uniref:NucT-like nuclease n=1 Tax=Arthrobacter phage Amelia TaxID=2599822 RepID=A0A5J6TT78_9CAUD|nr:NucT-like nuclease [Arthrobacter phage Amelia]
MTEAIENQLQLFRTGEDVPLNVAEGVDPAAAGIRVLARKRPVRRHRVLRTNSARIALDQFEPGMDYEVSTNGAFSLLDAILVLLERTGPADVAISTWSAGLYDVEVANRFLNTGLIKSIRFILDVSFRNNGGSRGYSSLLMDMFGEDCIRTTRTHAKFVTITNDEHKISISSTANLNENKRLEIFNFSDDPARAAWYLELVEAVYHDVKPGWNPDTGAPALGRLDPSGSKIKMADRSGVSMGQVKLGNG